MKKQIFRWCICVIFLACGLSFAYGQGLDNLADGASQSLIDFFKERYNVKTAIIKFENFSGASGQVAQKFYQLLVSRLETAEGIAFTDLMINFQQNKGTFNLNRIHPMNHLIYIRLTRNKTKLGAGVSVFSLTQDKVVYVKYVETFFSTPEREFYESEGYGFKSAGFSRVMEMAVENGLLDVGSFLDRQGRLRILFYYRDKIEFLQLSGSRLQKFYTYPLKWKRPIFPVLEEEGKLSVFYENSVLYVTVGGNFSRKSRIIAFTGEGLTDSGAAGDVADAELDFVPFRPIELNGSRFLAGARYVVGKNYFDNQLVLMPLEAGSVSAGQLAAAGSGSDSDRLVREVAPFYDLGFAAAPDSDALDSVHIIDREYTYRFLADNFQQMTEETGKRGSALGVLGGQWLALSDYSHGSDRLYFYKIEAGARQLVFENPVAGEIVFISGGLWKAAPGFWVYVKTDEPASGRTEYKLQFWSKKSE